MATGQIVTMRSNKGFGFISEGPGLSGENNIFFHRSVVTNGSFDALTEGQTVSFNAGPDPRDPSRFRATNVSPEAAGGEEPAVAPVSDEA